VRPTRSAGVRARHHEAGQVLPAAVFLLLACAAFLYWTVNSGQMVTEKMRLTNAADAAAYSAGIVHARALNFDAYTNRAIVANQVAIAQTLSLVSWGNYFTDVFCNLGGLADGVTATRVSDNPEIWGKLAAVAIGSAADTVYAGGEGCEGLKTVSDAWNGIAGAAISALNGSSVLLAASQRSLHLPLEAGLFRRSREAAQAVVDAVDSTMHAELVPTTYSPAGTGQGGTFVRLYSEGERDRLRDVVLSSRDSFTRQRDWTVRKLKVEPESHRIERRGTTTLRDLDTWVADDSMTHRWKAFRLTKWRDRSSVIGHGIAEAKDDPVSQSEVAMRSYNLAAIYTGLPAIHDLRDRSTNPARHRFGVTVVVEKDRADTLTSQHAAQAGPSGRLAVFDAATAPSRMAALARAEVVFERPPRADRRTEYANLFSPFWQVRLIPHTAQDRAFAAARQGNVALPAP
jgi:hypothetical protein